MHGGALDTPTPFKVRICILPHVDVHDYNIITNLIHKLHTKRSGNSHMFHQKVH